MHIDLAIGASFLRYTGYNCLKIYSYVGKSEELQQWIRLSRLEEEAERFLFFLLEQIC